MNGENWPKKIKNSWCMTLNTEKRLQHTYMIIHCDLMEGVCITNCKGTKTIWMLLARVVISFDAEFHGCSLSSHAEVQIHKVLASSSCDVHLALPATHLGTTDCWHKWQCYDALHRNLMWTYKSIKHSHEICYQPERELFNCFLGFSDKIGYQLCNLQ